VGRIVTLKWTYCSNSGNTRLYILTQPLLTTLADPKDSYSVKLLQPKGEEKERMRKYLAGYRVCHSGFGPDFRGPLCGSRCDYPYVLGGDQDVSRHENDGKIQI